MEIIYLVTSILLALLFFRGLGRYDGPRPNNRHLDRFYLNPNVGLDEKLNAMHHFGIRRSLSGSSFRATWMFVFWLSIPVVFGGMPEIGGLLFALPGGWALAVAAYNVRKQLRGW